MTVQQEVIHHVRMALMDEIKATDDYAKLEEMDPGNASIYREIRDDELNHQGLLVQLLMKKDRSQLGPFNKGLQERERG